MRTFLRYFCPKCPGECVPVGVTNELLRCTRCGRTDDATRLIRLGQIITGFVA